MLEFLEKFGANTNYVLAAVGIFFIGLALSLLNLSSSKTIGFMVATAPVWLPITTFFLFFETWMHFVQTKFDIEQGRVTLEIKIPQEIFKSPEAMELVLMQLYQTASPDNHIQTYWDGKHPPTTSLELVSRGGDVRFYMNVARKKIKNMAETHLYAQYPGIEVTELDIDYTAEIPWDPDRFEYFSIHFGLKKADALPIKTYVDYGLHTMPKEEEKVDPLTTMLEILGSIGPGEYIWIQILIDAHRDLDFKVGSLQKVPDWKVAAQEEIIKIIKDANKRVGYKEGIEGQTLNMMSLTDAEKDTIAAIERSIGKTAFNTAIRTMYIGKKGSYFPGERIGGLITGWKSFDGLNRNAIGFRWRTDFDWNMWQDPSGKRKWAMKKQEFFEYKARIYTPQVPSNHVDTPKVMTTEEIATIFHLPGKVAATPSLARIPSKRGEAPANLPTGNL